MPSIANQDYKIYGLLNDTEIIGIPGKYCGELYSAIAKITGAFDNANVGDGFVFSGNGDTIVRQLAAGFFFDRDVNNYVNITIKHDSSYYYDALWAIQQAYYAYFGYNKWNDTNMFGITAQGYFYENEDIDELLINEDGHYICGTAANGKLASLYLGEKAEHPESCAVVRLESLLPLVGELPLETDDIW